MTGRYDNYFTNRPWRGTGYLFLSGTPSDPLSRKKDLNLRHLDYDPNALPIELFRHRYQKRELNPYLIKNKNLNLACLPFHHSDKKKLKKGSNHYI